MRSLRCLLAVFLLGAPLCAQTLSEAARRAQEYFVNLLRLDTSNPPGNETRVAEYLRSVALAHGIECELLGDDPDRLNFVARLKGSGRQRPLLLMAHSDVVPADRSAWSVDPFAASIRGGAVYGRGAEDTKDLLAAELAVLVELKLRGAALDRDIILLSEADEEAASTGIRWLIANAWEKIDAEFALNEGGAIYDTPQGARLFRIQTAEKIPTRVALVARGTAGHAAAPRADNAVVALARGIVKLAGAESPVKLNPTTDAYLEGLSGLPEYAWLRSLLPSLRNPQTAPEAASRIRDRSPDLAGLLCASFSPTVLRAGSRVNVIPNTAEALIDVRRLPGESPTEVFERIRRIVNEPAVEVRPLGETAMPSPPPSPLTSSLYRTMERILGAAHPRALILPYMGRGASDSSYLRDKGVSVYGAPLFLVEGEDRSHGNDERRSFSNLRAGTDLLMQIVLAVAE